MNPYRKKILPHKFTLLKRTREESNKISTINKYLDLIIKSYSSSLIVGASLGSYFIFFYLKKYNAVEVFTNAITEPNILILLALSSLIFATGIISIFIVSPYIYDLIKTITKDRYQTNQRQELLFDFFAFYVALTLPIILLETKLHEVTKDKFIYFYIGLLFLLSIITLSLRRPSFDLKDKKDIFKITTHIFAFTFGMLIIILPLTLILNGVSNIQTENEYNDLFQIALFLSIAIIYPFIISLILNLEKKILPSIAIIGYMAICSMVLFPEYLSEKIISFSKIGLYETNIAFKSKMPFMGPSQTEGTYNRYWVLINFSNSMVISDNKTMKPFHVINNGNILDIKALE